jgi:uncharacterized protein (TIGR02646 family)
MIRVKKSYDAPSSLTTTSRYDGEDVKEQLLADQNDKCYLCERKRDTDFEIEHHKSAHNYPSLVQDWNNLYMGCGYCNRKKSDSFDNTLVPRDCNIEDEIEQTIDYANKKVVFLSKVDDEQHDETIRLLDRIYNNANQPRKVKEEHFFEQAIGVMNRFTDLVMKYQESPTPETEKAVRDELSIEKELLGFKYWIIKSDRTLSQVFAADIIWNKTA